MADAEQLARIWRGMKDWNAWMVDNPDVKVDLTRALLNEADLNGAELRRAELRGACLVNANLREAYLRNANLRGAWLRGSDLSRADLTEVDLVNADLSGANLSEVQLFETIFSDTNLKNVVGLESCIHLGPSTIDYRTLAQSWPLPEVFLRGCGLPDNLITYLPSLLSAGALQFYSCFISYSSKDQEFADRLYADLQNTASYETLRRASRPFQGEADAVTILMAGQNGSGKKRSTAYRHVKQLRDAGFLVLDSRGNLSVGECSSEI